MNDASGLLLGVLVGGAIAFVVIKRKAAAATKPTTVDKPAETAGDVVAPTPPFVDPAALTPPTGYIVKAP